MSRLKARMESLTRGQDLADQGQAILASELERWGSEVSAVISRFASEQESLLQEASGSFRESLSAAVASSVGVELSVSLSVVEEPVDISDLSSQCEQLEQERQRLLAELEPLQREIEADKNALPELCGNLTAVVNQLKGMKYEPQMVTQEVGGSGAVSDALGAVGSAIDFGLLLSPIPMKGLGWISKLPAGKTLGRCVKYVNKAILAKNKWLKRKMPIPGGGRLGNLLDLLSCEGILRKVGEAIDGPAKTITFEDPEARHQYQEQVRPYRAKEEQLKCELQKCKADLELKRQRREAILQGAQGLSESQEQLKREMAEIERGIRRRNDERLLFEGRQQLLEQAYALLTGPEAEAVRPVLEHIDEQFAAVKVRLSQELERRQAKTLADLRAKMAECEASLQGGVEERAAHLAQLRRQDECLKSVLEQLKPMA